MPGTPATSPRFGVNRYADTDTAAFSTQVNAITVAFDAAAAKLLVPTATSTNLTASDGKLIVVTGGSPVITLPAHAAKQQIGVINIGSGAPTVVGTAIQGRGLSGATTFTLGAVGARAILMDDGTNWLVIGGEQDTGWVAITSFFSGASAGGTYVPKCRLIGDEVVMRGEVIATAGSGSVGLCTLPSQFWPSYLHTFALGNNSVGLPCPSCTVGTNGALSASGDQLSGWPAGSDGYFLDGISYTLD